MAKRGEKRYFSYIKGLNTEAGPLTFPENSWSAGSNVVPQIDGSVKKRLAVDAEEGYELSSSFASFSLTSAQEQRSALVVDEWTSAGGSGSVNLTVVQMGTRVMFFTNVAEGQSATYISSITLSTVSGNTSIAGTAPISCYSAHGKLLVCSQDTDPILLTYENGVITSETISVEIRDVYGVDDGLAVNERPSTLSTTHNYNLLNQGWDATKQATYYASASKYPSNAQVWTAGKDSNDLFSATQLDKIDFGTSPAAKGRFIFSLFNRDRTAASGVAGITTETETFRPAAVAFWAGRAWYAGVRSSSISNWITYSQVSDTAETFGKCYQEADPTSEQSSDLVATDGGVIPIQEAATILRLVPYNSTLLVFADNGVWAIRGGVDDVFSATSYSVQRLSSVGCIAPRSLVESEQGVMYWGVNGIYLIRRSEGGSYVVDNLTATTIQTLYNDIPENNKPHASGRYFQKDKVVYWLYSATEHSGTVHRYKCNRILALDTRLGAFYTLSLGELASNSPYVFDLFVSKPKATTDTDYTVVDSDEDTVIDSSSNTVQATLTEETYTQSRVKLGVIWPTSSTAFPFTFGEFSVTATSPQKFKDWYSKDTAGIGYASYLLTGYDLGPNGFGATRDFNALYVHVFMNRTETGIDGSGQAINPSSCMLSARWDWADTDVAGKWSTAYEVYRHNRLFLGTPSTSTYDDGYPVVSTRNKVRGRGKSVQFYFLADEDKDMQLVGWQVPFIGDDA